MHDALPTCQSTDGVDVQTLLGNHLCGCLYLCGRERPTHQRQDIAVLALSAYPCLVFVIGYRGKSDVHTQLGGLEEQFLHHLSRVSLVNANQDAQRQGGMDVCLPYVENLGIMAGKDGHD